MKMLVVGPGQIGKELALQARQRGHTASFFGRNDSRDTFRGIVLQSDVVCITISTKGRGEAEVFYTLESRFVGKPVVIAAKGGFAYHSEKLLPHLRHMGVTTTAGGASGMLSLILTPQIGLEKIVTIANGTLNFFFSRTAQGLPWEEVLVEAQKKGLTEGGADLVQVFNGEVRDTILKTSGIGNLARIFTQPLTPDDFSYSVLERQEILRLFEAKKYRFVVRMVKQPRRQTYSIFPGFYVRKEDWDIVGEFAKPDETEFQGKIPDGEQNTLIVWNSIERSQITGIGAGVIPTAATMLGEAEWLVANRKN